MAQSPTAAAVRMSQKRFQNFTGPKFLANTNVLMNTSLPSGLSVSSFPGTMFNLTTMRVNSQEYEAGISHQVEIILGKQVHIRSTNGTASSRMQYIRHKQHLVLQRLWCGKLFITYTSTIEAGELHKTAVSTSDHMISSWGYMVYPPSQPPAQFRPLYASMVNTACLSDNERLSLMKEGYHLDPGTRWLAYNLTFDPDKSDSLCPKTSNNTSSPCQNVSGNASFPQSMLVSECLYIMDDLLIGNLWADYLDDFCQGTVEGEASLDSIGVLRGTQNVQTNHNYGNVSFDRVNETFQNISDSMTKFIRQNSFSRWSNPAEGVVMHNQTCLSVRWPWLAFPAVLVLLAASLFVVIIIDTRPTGSRAPIWKSSPLPLLFHGLELINKSQAAVNDVNEMEDLAKGLIVRLGPAEEGLKFVESGTRHTKSL